MTERPAMLQRTVEILRDLVAFETVSTDSNLQMVVYIADRLAGLAADVAVTSDRSGAKANLFATFSPAAGTDKPGIVLSGHTDVVPVEGQDWTGDPFVLREREGLLYGRGTCDMKGFIAACLAMAPEFAAWPLARPLHFAFTHDEETGCLGARALVAELRQAGLRPAAAIIGEPTEMRIIEGHKGCHEYTTEFRGLEGHGSLPDGGVNAIEYAVRYIARLMELREQLKNSTPRASRFTPPYTTLQVGRIQGGVAHNVIAGQCSVDWEMRPVQQADVDYVKHHIEALVERDLKPAMRAVSADADIVTHVIGEIQGLEPVAESEALRIAAELTGSRATDVVSFGTEAGLFQSIGISAVVCGPGSIEQAHKADEFVSLDQLTACLAMLGRLSGQLTR